MAADPEMGRLPSLVADPPAGTIPVERVSTGFIGIGKMATASDRFGIGSADSEKAKSHREALQAFWKTWTGRTLLERVGGELAPEYALDAWFRVTQRILGGKWDRPIPVTDYGPKEIEILEIPNGAVFLQELPDGGLAVTVDYI